MSTYATAPMPTRTEMTTPTAFTVVAATTVLRRRFIGSVLSRAYAVGARGLLAGGVRADGRTRDDDRGVHADLPTGDRQREAVEPARCRAALLLAVAVVLRAVALALEPLRRLALWHPAPEVDALLVERGVASLHARELLGVHAACGAEGSRRVLR